MGSNTKNRLRKFFQGWTGSIILAFLIAMTFKSMIADWNDVPSGSMKPTIVEGDRIFVNKLAYDLKIPFWPFGKKPYKTIQLIRWDDPKRGDIVVFFSPLTGTRLVKRVVGLPGDTVELLDNRLIVNRKAVAYENLTATDFPDLGSIDKWAHDFYMELLDFKKHAVMIKNKEKLIEELKKNGYSEEAIQEHLDSLLIPFLFQIPKNSYVMIGDNRTNSADSRVFQYVDRRQIVGRAVAIAISREGSIFKGRFRGHRFFKKLI